MRLSWSEYFMAQAITASLKSKDPSTKVGCVIVDPNTKKQIAMGYNGFPKGIDESHLTWNKDRNQGIENTKYPYVVHAEANALMNAYQSVSGADVYVTLQPCSECVKLLISAQIGRIFYLDPRPCKMAEKMLNLAKIPCKEIYESEKDRIYASFKQIKR